jgi:hypothetical protein
VVGAAKRWNRHDASFVASWLPKAVIGYILVHKSRFDKYFTRFMLRLDTFVYSVA